MLSGYEHLIGGLSGGTVATFVCHPLDLMRIRYSANEGSAKRPQYRSYLHAFRSIVQAEGFRGLYQGLTPNIIAAPIAWGLYFHFYHQIHNVVGVSSDPDKQSFVTNLLVGCAAGGIVMALTNPLWVAKTRLCLQYENSTKIYSGMTDCLRKIYAKEGVQGLYKGFLPGLVGTINGSIQFAIYNFLKDRRCASLGLAADAKLSTVDYLLFSSVSKILSTMSTYPYQVVRTRVQDHNTAYNSIRHCLAQTWKHEGLGGFYKGAAMATVKQMPTGVITYLVYEHTRRLAEKL
ncbi:Mitochondrial folate transporter/carrier [Aphelenchoides besseyi]|nr:Mitochondrial folate transporter/carrier [Aphelenchoides besseyi]KAI6232335.1 Mitochondrial folate transporter/carrier [Aphelenchoides besseyi]